MVLRVYGGIIEINISNKSRVSASNSITSQTQKCYPQTMGKLPYFLKFLQLPQQTAKKEYEKSRQYFDQTNRRK